MTRYLLDTNIVSYFLRRQSAVVRKIVARPLSDLCVSSITAGEIHFGVVRRPAGSHRARAALGFLAEVEILPWDDRVAATYGQLRASLQASGISLATMDLLIAAHALSEGAVLVSGDRAMQQLTMLQVEDWTLGSD